MWRRSTKLVTLTTLWRSSTLNLRRSLNSAPSTSSCSSTTPFLATPTFSSHRLFRIDISLYSFSFLCESAESKSTNDSSRDQPVVPVVSSSTTTTSNTLSTTSSTPNRREELKISSLLQKFSYNELKSATWNFRTESLFGEGGFGWVYKGWINENGTSQVKPGMGLPVAVKTLNHDGLQGHKEWLV
ncbi:hypothetical protein Patl1_22172 [Pistacia atlantica]|uniref:Uncharacterized protein n=1 Tax=Pistacia atlantica TaxID=434234 RepID=A0ACC1BIE6_9ROSI|nr:hypothetical protein Patl1_22172 [Pistacia atlantica]